MGRRPFLTFQNVNVAGETSATLTLNVYFQASTHVADMTWGISYRFNGGKRDGAMSQVEVRAAAMVEPRRTCLPQSDTTVPVLAKTRCRTGDDRPFGGEAPPAQPVGTRRGRNLRAFQSSDFGAVPITEAL